MPIPQFLTTETAIQNLLASVMKQQSWAQMATLNAGTGQYWATIEPLGHQLAADKIFRSFVQRGYLPATIAQWDSGALYETILGVGESVILGGGLEQAGKAFIEQYRAYDKMLMSVLLTINGVWQWTNDSPGTVNVGQLTTAMNGMPLLPPGSRFGRGGGYGRQFSPGEWDGCG
jgi:hypothetical protein